MGILTLSWCFLLGVLVWLTQHVLLGPPSSEIWLGQSCSAPLLIFVCSQPSWSCKYAALVTREVADVPCPASLLLDPSYGCYHHMCVLHARVLERSFLLKSLIWNDPTCALLPILTTVSTPFFLGVSAPPLPSEGISSTTTHRDNSCARCTVNHGVEIRSISLSLITLMTRARVQVPITIGTHLPKFDPSGTTKNTTSFIVPCHLSNLKSGDHKSQRTHASATQPHQM